MRVFRSVARGDDRPASDLDLLVDTESGRSLSDLVGLAQNLEALMHRRRRPEVSGKQIAAMRERRAHGCRNSKKTPLCTRSRSASDSAR